MPTPIYVVTLHSGGGSMVEASEPIWSCAVKDEALAEKIRDTLSRAISASPDSYVRQEWWPNVLEVYHLADQDVPKATAAQIAQLEQITGQKVTAGHATCDFAKLVEKLADGEEIGLLPDPPPPVTEDEEAEALRSILGAG